MSSSSHTIIDELCNRTKHPALLSEIAVQLLQGDYRYFQAWRDILKVHQTLETKTTESDTIVQKIVPQIIAECEQGIEQNNSHAIILRASMYQCGPRRQYFY